MKNIKEMIRLAVSDYVFRQELEAMHVCNAEVIRATNFSVYTRDDITYCVLEGITYTRIKARNCNKCAAQYDKFGLCGKLPDCFIEGEDYSWLQSN